MSFRCLSVDAVLTILNALILERKVILLSSHARLLTPVAQTLLSLMFPLEWQYSYVPVLPRVVSVILDAPMPVFVGIQKAYADPRFVYYVTARSSELTILCPGYMTVQMLSLSTWIWERFSYIL